MGKLTANLVQESTATLGTGDVTLSQMTGWIRFGSRFSIGDRLYYSIRDGNNWEVGKGTYSAANQLSRTTILETLSAGTFTSGGAPLNLSGAAIVRAVATEQLLTSFWKVEFIPVGLNATLEAGGSYAVYASGITLTLPLAPLAGDRIEIVQSAANVTGVVVNPNGQLINGVAGNMTIDTTDFSFSLIYMSGAYGWKVNR